ncbi:hypothetical protein QIN80_gp3 [ssRNA phage Gerhypos.2_7]|uniref:Uncharacterized protein n=1 Tax=ssRNA phage Gerhypos.2_7 TaxID=2786279 RepID=A0A8S5KYE7_9VIRU|nr:hypothetical protein QIN80_gp3 [ssRNA phage Gerhypos.2_7]DAD50441.1 TPA_asm: hypothetical protein [ssRNA phage Gerhypos.2_7]
MTLVRGSHLRVLCDRDSLPLLVRRSDEKPHRTIAGHLG